MADFLSLRDLVPFDCRKEAYLRRTEFDLNEHQGIRSSADE
jgi:hypothetical protein